MKLTKLQKKQRDGMQNLNQAFIPPKPTRKQNNLNLAC